MAKNDAIAEAIAADSYLKPRKSSTEAEQQLHLKEVSFACPLCGKNLRHRKQKKSNKLYEIAHIFPNSPTEEQYELLKDLPRLGENSESYDNKIALCKDCHAEQDYHTTQEDYLELLEKKQYFLRIMDLQESVLMMNLESEIADVVKKVVALKEEELFSLNYTPVKLSKKFTSDELLLKNKVAAYVTTYYPYIRDLFKEIEGINYFSLNAFSLKMKSCYKQMEVICDDKNDIFDQLTRLIMSQTQTTSKNACEAVVSFFVQNCEVFDEITE